MTHLRAAGHGGAAPGSPLTQGTLGEGMAFLRLGAGPPLVFLPGLAADHHPPQGLARWFQVQQIRPYARRREVWWIQRRAGLTAPVTMAGLAADYAYAIARQFGEPVDVLGVSTGGSIALQLAADHPAAVRRLVLISASCRLGAQGRAMMQRVAAALREGRARRAGALMMSMLGSRPLSRRLLAAFGWALGDGVLGNGHPDLLATIAAEDAFDLTQRLGSIHAPVMVAGGERDAFYDGRVFGQTAALLPHARLILYRGKGHLSPAARPLAREVLAFLAGGHPAPG